MSGSNCGIKLGGGVSIYIRTCILQTGDGQSISEKQFVPGLISNDGCHFCEAPQFRRSVHQATLRVVIFFFPLISEGEDEVKKVQFFN